MAYTTTQHGALRRSILWLLIILGLGAAWFFWGSGMDTVPKMARMAAPATPVAVAVAADGQIARLLRAPGTVTAPAVVTIRARVDGTLLALHFQDGQYVYQDDLLATIDPEPFRIRLEQALGQQTSRVAQLDIARRDLARYEALYRQDSVARQQLDAARAQVLQLEGQARSDQAAVDEARLQLGYTEIRAPLEGRLGLHQIDVGNLIRAGDPEGLVVLTQSRPMDVLFAIPQTRLPELRLARRQQADLPVRLHSGPADVIRAQGRLLAVDNQIDVATGTVRLKARFDNTDEALFPNEFVQVSLELGVQKGVVVPLRAVQRGASGEYVYRVTADGQARTAPVTTGADDGRRVVIESGLQAGDTVVVEGVDRLRDGSLVEIVTGAAQEAGS
ncbi:efflux RND transporter periplasmic adaptor subunit [Castellaniella sp.]|uniref:efflux RND transporter periplasmic adaptor subunit n=1 Tax=Castellaniella sp. TaxID=1955812 RepID=UPI00355E5B61